MAIADAIRWLDGVRDFRTGVRILEYLDPNNRQLKLLAGAESSFSFGKLEKELQLLVDKGSQGATDPLIVPDLDAEPQAENPHKAAPLHAKGKHKLGQVDGYPKQLVELDRQVYFQYKKIQELRGFLYALEEGPELKEIALTILRLNKDKNDNWRELHHYARTGEFYPGTEPETGKQYFARLMRGLKNNPSYISKNKDSTDPETMAEIERRKAELEEARIIMKEN